jgi:hypothetical protein
MYLYPFYSDLHVSYVYILILHYRIISYSFIHLSLNVLYWTLMCTSNILIVPSCQNKRLIFIQSFRKASLMMWKEWNTQNSYLAFKWCRKTTNLHYVYIFQCVYNKCAKFGEYQLKSTKDYHASHHTISWMHFFDRPMDRKVILLSKYWKHFKKDYDA